MRCLFVVTLVCMAICSMLGQELPNDANTLLLLHFNNSPNGSAGEIPTVAQNLTYQTGIHNQGILIDASSNLSFSTVDNILPQEGTIEFWIQPQWNGNVATGNFFVTIGNQLSIVKDGIGNLRFVFNGDDSEAFQADNLGYWQSGEWHHLALTWTIPGRMKTYINGELKIDHTSSNVDLMTNLSAELTIGAQFNNEYADAVFDEFRISNIARTQQEIISSYLAGFTIDTLCVFEDCHPFAPLTSLTTLPSWRHCPRIEAKTATDTFTIPISALQWSSSNAAVADVDVGGTGKVCAKSTGMTTLTGTLQGKQIEFDVQVNAPTLAPISGSIDPYLANINYEFVVKEVPVVIIRYLPTADGVNLDVGHAPDFWVLGESTLADMEDRLDAFDQRIKFSVQEGTRFRDYGQNEKIPYLGYKVIEYITVYEATPRGKVAYMDDNGFAVHEIDYHSMFERFNLKDLVNNQGVREVWIWSYGHDSTVPSYDENIHDPCDFRFWWESNMSSPTSGDISNSNRDISDLPLYDHTYIVYNQNIRRSQAEAVHNRGHQFEHMFTYLDGGGFSTSPIFWQSFVGYSPTGQPGSGRCGWTHMPPNTTVDYDYYNAATVDSDIEDWNPDQTGAMKAINYLTWENLPYSWPGESNFSQQTESNWYIYWMQSFPGFNNKIPYGSDHRMSNWWDVYCDWDAAILEGKSLVEPLCDPALNIPSPTLTGIYSALGPITYTGMVPMMQYVVITSDTDILIDAGVEIESGSAFEAYIQDCGGSSAHLSFKNPSVQPPCQHSSFTKVKWNK